MGINSKDNFPNLGSTALAILNYYVAKSIGDEAAPALPHDPGEAPGGPQRLHPRSRDSRGDRFFRRPAGVRRPGRRPGRNCNGKTAYRKLRRFKDRRCELQERSSCLSLCSLCLKFFL